MDKQHECAEGKPVAQPLPKKAYKTPALMALGSFSDLTLTVGGRGKNDGGRQRGKNSTRA